jgi:hypothetical protein
MSKVPAPAPRTTKAIAKAAKDHRVTRKESLGIVNAIGADLKANSKNPGWVQASAIATSAQLDKLSSRADVVFEPAVKEMLAASRGVLASTLGAPNVDQGTADAKFIADAFAKDTGSNLRLLGQPYQAVDPRSVSWTYQQGVGVITIGFDRAQLEPQFIADPTLLSKAISELPAILKSSGATPEEVLHFERSPIKAAVIDLSP